MGTVIPVYSSTDYQFFKLHELPEKYLDECAELLSDEWSSKNPAGRRRILQSSSNDLPIHFALVEITSREAHGHIKLCRCLNNEYTFYAESVCVAKKVRGRGLGRIIMSFTERYIREHLAGNRICLQTLDAQGFYENIGYKKCTPVQFTKLVLATWSDN